MLPPRARCDKEPHPAGKAPYTGNEAAIKGEQPDSTMPKFGQTLSEDQIWKILAYARALYQGDPALMQW